MVVVRRLRVVWTHGDGPSYGGGTGHHTVPPLNLGTDIFKLPVVGIGVSTLLYTMCGSARLNIWLSVDLSAVK